MININIKESDFELLDGFPESIQIESDIPSTIYYTLDGSEPTVNSLIAIGDIYLPTLAGTIRVRAIAISGDKKSNLLEKTYKNDSTNIDGRRNLIDEGIKVFSDGGEAVESLGFNSEGDVSRKSLIPMVELDLKASKTDSIGNEIPGGKTSLDFVNFEIKKEVKKNKVVSSPNNNPNFDPLSPVIHIDGFSAEARQNQVVKIVNRPYNNFGPTTNFYKERLGQKEPIVTGNYVRSFYNPRTKKYVSFYWESLESRWIRSEQLLEGKETLFAAAGNGNRFVYMWVQDRALSQLF